MAKTISLDIMDMWHKTEPKLVLNLSGYKEFRVRTWLATKLVSLACWIAHMGLEIEEENE